MQMLWNRNVFDRVQSVLIPGLVEDPAAYLASDGKSIFYVVQIYIDYPMQSGFSASPYLRFFGVALVNVADGSMNFYNVSNLVGTGPSDFITQVLLELLQQLADPPAWLVPQLRYPGAAPRHPVGPSDSSTTTSPTTSTTRSSGGRGRSSTRGPPTPRSSTSRGRWATRPTSRPPSSCTTRTPRARTSQACISRTAATGWARFTSTRTPRTRPRSSGPPQPRTPSPPTSRSGPSSPSCPTTVSARTCCIL